MKNGSEKNENKIKQHIKILNLKILKNAQKIINYDMKNKIMLPGCMQHLETTL